MKLIKCRNCGKMIGSNAKRCKHCGTLLRMPLVGLIITISLILFIVGLIVIGILQTG